MADSFNTTNLLGGSSAIEARSRVYGVTRSQLMTRAWQLACLNKRTATSSLKDGFGRWLAAAWAEAREGNTSFWPANFSRRNALRAEIASLNAKDTWDRSDYPLMAALSAELRSLLH